ncbi:MAG: NAD(P)-binding domain-containing protein [Calditrichaeota bacterium]|nr:NAD(P)-binding domain-containing protein [Calditrichota bacterium]
MGAEGTLGFIGGGRVTRLLLEGLRRADGLPRQVVVYDPEVNNIERLSTIVGDLLVKADNSRAVAEVADWVFLAVHPPVAAEVCGQIKSALKRDATLISLIPTIRLHHLSGMLNGFNRIVRMIPNAPSMIGRGYNPVVYSDGLTAGDRSSLVSLFRHWGESPEVPEEHLEAYAIVTGMGPTYFWFQWLELMRLGTEFGLSEPGAREAMAAMLHGAVDAMFHSQLPAEQVLDLIPVHPLKNDEEAIRQIFQNRLGSLYQKLKTATR